MRIVRLFDPTRVEPAPAADVVVLHVGDAIFGDNPRTSGRSLYVRVSRLSSGSIDRDLRWAMAAGANGIVLPRTVGLADIERLGAKLCVAEAEAGLPNGATRILAVAGDTPAGALALSSLRSTSRLAGLAHDPASLAIAIGCDQSASAVAQAGAMVVLAAASCGVEAVLVTISDDNQSKAAAERAGFRALLVTA